MTMAKKKELGLGIRALLSNIEDGNIPKEKGVKKLAKAIGEIAISNIIPNPNQPRVEFDANALKELSESIKIHGIIQPLTVRSLGDGNYQLISGERRFRAAKKAGLDTLPAYIRVADDQGLLEMALVENIQRKDLNALEIAISCQRLIDECSLTHKSLSGRLGKQRSTITNYLRLLKLPPQIQQALKSEELSMGHARALAGIEDPLLQLTVFRKIKSGSLSVRQTEKLIAQKGEKPAKKTNSNSAETPELKKIREGLSSFFGTKVVLNRNKQGKGQIVIPFNDDNELNDLLEILAD
jgi:ParB family chromosome partitioning protein